MKILLIIETVVFGVAFGLHFGWWVATRQDGEWSPWNWAYTFVFFAAFVSCLAVLVRA